MRRKSAFRCAATLAGSVLALAATVAVAAGPPQTGGSKRSPAVTCELELRQLEPPGGESENPADAIYRLVDPQSCYINLAGGSQAADDDLLVEFRKVVKKEPKYVSKEKVRAVATLGGKAYGFALDKKDDKSRPLSRLYFDFNGNGDLTDDPPIDAQADAASAAPGNDNNDNFASSFPHLKVVLDIGGAKVDYAFSFDVYGRLRESNVFDGGHVQVSLTPAVCREGHVELNGKKHRLVLLDANTNGKFDDKMEVSHIGEERGGRVYAQTGDVLLIDPDGKADADRLANGNAPGFGDARQPLSKLRGSTAAITRSTSRQRAIG